MIQIQKKQLTQTQIKKRKQFQTLLTKQAQNRQNIKQAKQQRNKQKRVQQNMVRSQNITAQLKDKQNRDFNKILKCIQDLKDYFASVLYALTGYDKQNYKQSIQKLQSTVYQIKSQVQPRVKFKFTKRDKNFVQVKNKITPIIKTQHTMQKMQLKGIKQIKEGKILVNRSQIKQGFQIIDCQNCQINLQGITHALHIKRLKNCIIKSGPSSSSVHVSHCIGCTFNIVAHQIRIHDTTDTLFNIFASSKPIIQNCNKLIFTPLFENWYSQMQKDMKQCGLLNMKNLWFDVQDFNWLKNQKSPNYQLKQ